MLFNSLDYLLFLLLAVSGYWVLAMHTRARMAFLFVASCAFYMAWSPKYIFLILGSAVLDYTIGRLLHTTEDEAQRKALLLVSLTGNLGLLGLFKYFNFFADATADGLSLFGIEVTPPHLNLLLPVGISFYTFQTLSYTIDIYRRRMPPVRSFLQFAVFVTYFPQLVAGPIVRAGELLPQLPKPPRMNSEQVGTAVFLLLTGLTKKIALADYLAVNLVDRVFTEPTAYSGMEVMLGLYGYTMQIYCDFSGYTDVARGSAMLMGLSLPENFDRPYQARSPAEFWRRWHMTLSAWLRDYLYFPLGGSKRGPIRNYINLFLTMFLIGMWHGADWNFVIYGSIQGVAVVIHRFIYRRFGPPNPDASALVNGLKVFGTLHLAVLSRVFFRGEGIENATDVATQLLHGGAGIGHVTGSVWLALLIGYAAHYTPRRWMTELQAQFVALPAPAQALVAAGVGALLMLVVSQDVVPYIYFQF